MKGFDRCTELLFKWETKGCTTEELKELRGLLSSVSREVADIISRHIDEEEHGTR